MALRNESRFVPDVRIDSSAMAKILRSVSSWKGGSSGGTYSTDPMPCMPAMSAIVSTGSPPDSERAPPGRRRRGGAQSLAWDGSDGPGVDLEGPRPPRREGGVEDVER